MNTVKVRNIEIGAGVPKICVPIVASDKKTIIEAAKKMNDIPVDVFGNGWDIVPFAGKLKLHGPVSYEQSLEIASQAKIIFQDQADFNHGAHDRVFTGMLNGAVVVSEFSHYLAEEFEAGRDLFMFDWQNGDQQVQVNHELLADESKRLSVAVSAYGKAVRRHRWANRAERILEAVDVLYGVEV